MQTLVYASEKEKIRDDTSRSPIYIIPGQGDNPVGALQPLYEGGDPARAMIDETLEIVKAVLRDHHDGVDPQLVRAVLLGEASSGPIPIGVPQLCAFTNAVCLHRILKGLGFSPAAIIGQSLGEIASLVCAGVWSLSDGVRAVLAMNTAFRPFEGQGGMVVLMATEADTLRLLDAIANDDLVLACVNAPRQTVVSGTNAALDELIESAIRHRLKAYPLAIPYPAHHPALQSAADAFHDTVLLFPQRDFQVPVYSAVSRRRYTASDNLARSLADSFTKPYHMPATLENSGLGQDAFFVDLSLTGMMSSRVRAVWREANVMVPRRVIQPDLI